MIMYKFFKAEILLAFTIRFTNLIKWHEIPKMSVFLYSVTHVLVDIFYLLKCN